MGFGFNRGVDAGAGKKKTLTGSGTISSFLHFLLFELIFGSNSVFLH